MLERTFTKQTRVPLPSQAWFRRVAETTLRQLKLNHNRFSLALVFTAPAGIKRLNQQYRGHNKVTNVLAFPLQKKKVYGAMKRGAIIDLGDIFICPAVAKKQTALLGEKLTEQMAWLLVHGLLHLLGYDHVGSATAEEKFLRLQVRLLQSLSL